MSCKQAEIPQGRTKKCEASVLATFSREEKMLAGREKMRLPTKSGFAMATILAACFGFAGLTRAAPLAGLAAAVPAVQMTQVPSAVEALPEKAYHHGYGHRPYGYKHRKYYKPVYKKHYGYKHRYGYKKPPEYPKPEYPKPEYPNPEYPK
jgi:hypothetical protein